MGIQKKEGDATLTTIKLSRESRTKLKMQALKKGLTLKEYLRQIADKQ